MSLRKRPNRHQRAAVVALLSGVAAGSLPCGVARADLFGSNLDGISYYDTAAIWADAIRNFNGPGLPSNPSEPNNDITYDAFNNPQQDFGALANLVNYPDGTYKFSYSYANGTPGTAQVLLGFDNFGGMTNVQTVGATTTADVTIRHPNGNPSSGSLLLIVQNNDANNPVSNIHLIGPGYSTTNTPVYTNSFIQRTQLFSSLRFMDWSATNNSAVSTWSQRPVGNQSNIQGANGAVSYENEIALANATGHDAWINVPYLADDNYVRQMADLFKSKLNPNAHIQVELSNEVWNSGFSQFFQNLSAAQANPDTILNPGDDGFTRAAREYALRAMQVSNIFHQEFGAQANRVQFVYGGQNSLTYWAKTGLDFINAKFGDPNKPAAQNISQWFSALGIAPYFGDDSAEVQAHSQNVDTLMNYILTQVGPGGYLDGTIKDAKTQADLYGLKLYAYEGGDSLPKNSNGLSEAMLRAAQSDARMYQALSTLYDTWHANGGDLFMAFSHVGGDTGGGLWGLLNNDSLTGSQKWDATISRLVPAGDANLDGTVDYKDLLLVAQNFGKTGSWWQDGDFNHDGVVDALDLAIVAGDYGNGIPFAGYSGTTGAASFAADWALAQASVPEPTTASLAVFAAGAALLRRRRRSPQQLQDV